MDMNEYQALALRTSVPHRTPRARMDNAILGLCGEIGEVADLWKKHLFHGHDLDLEMLIEELGDILWYLSLTANALGIEFQEMAERNIRKLQERYPEGFSSEKSINRES